MKVILLIYNLIVIVLGFFVVIPSIMLYAAEKASWLEKMLSGLSLLTIPVVTVSLIVLPLIFRSNEEQLMRWLWVTPTFFFLSLVFLVVLGLLRM